MPTQSDAFMVDAGETRMGGPLFLLGETISIKITGRDTSGKYTIFENATPVNGGPPLHMHHREDEWFYVLEGEFLFQVGDRRIRAATGATLFAPHDVPHTFLNVGRTPGRTLVVAEPAGVEMFFVQMAAACVNGPPDPAAILPIFEKHGLELLGPPLTAQAESAG
ncbi:MAG: cupin domain-containing protein [Bryobacteraceae bacterium]|nr:cupin domain-containing protein [Bryobacteraceae bacterium]